MRDTRSLHRSNRSAALGVWVWVAVASACASTAADGPGPTGGVAVSLAALSGSPACSPTWNGTGTLPAAGADAIAKLTLRWKELDNGSGAAVTIAAAQVAANGTWNVGALPVSQKLQLEVFACTADGRVAWYGKAGDYSIKEGEETTARVFMTPPGKVACTGNGGSGGAPQSARAFAGGALLPGGNAILVGGADKWDGKSATAAVATDVYDYRWGRWRPGPKLTAARIWPRVFALDATHALVVGGSQRVGPSSDADAISLLMPADLGATGALVPAAEVLELTDDGGKSTPSPAQFGVGGGQFAGGTLAGDALVFAGGLTAAGEGRAEATRVRGLAGLAALGAGSASEPLQLAAARVQPAVVAYADGGVIVWGGQTSGKVADLGEYIAPDASAGAPLAASGDAVLTAPDATATTLGAAAVVLGEAGDTLTFLVTGGAPLNSGFATGTLSYLVVADRHEKTARCVQIALAGGGALPGGLGVAATVLDGGFILITGGLLGLGKVDPAFDPLGLCQKPEQTKNGCLVPGFALIAPPTLPLIGAQVTLTPVAVDGTGSYGRHFGQTAIGLRVGALVTGGLQTAVAMPDGASEIFEAAAQIVSAPWSDAANQDGCR